MNLIRATAAGRPVQAGPRTLFLSPPSLRGMAMILAFLEGRVRPDGDATPVGLPDMTGEFAFSQYATPGGAALLLYVTTRRDHPDLTIEQAAGLVSEMDEEAITGLVRSSFVRHAVGNAHRPARKPDEGQQSGKGVESIDFGPLFEAASAKRFPPQALAEMSMDQFENVLAGGDLDPEDALSFDEVMEIYEAYRPKKDE